MPLVKMTPQTFVDKWDRMFLSEIASAQSHFLAEFTLCLCVLWIWTLEQVTHSEISYLPPFPHRQNVILVGDVD